MRYAFRTLKLVVEPGGAVCLAAVLAGKAEAAGRVTGLTLSGGNVDAELYRAILAADDSAPSLADHRLRRDGAAGGRRRTARGSRHTGAGHRGGAPDASHTLEVSWAERSVAEGGWR